MKGMCPYILAQQILALVPFKANIRDLMPSVHRFNAEFVWFQRKFLIGDMTLTVKTCESKTRKSDGISLTSPTTSLPSDSAKVFRSALEALLVKYTK